MDPMDDDFAASQGADLLSLALARQPGASDLDDFVDFEVYFDAAASTPAEEALTFLHARLVEVFELLLPELDQYLWHRDRFVLEPVVKSDEPHLAGHLRIGDGSEDEWFVVHLLRRLTTSRPDVACRILDADGELLLIEAALAAPRWVSPANAEHRCWLREGVVHLLPRPKEGEPQQMPLREGLRVLRRGGHAARGKMQKAIDARLEGYPKRAYELSRHVVRAVLPRRVAQLIVAFPQLIAVILDHLPTPPSRELLRLRRDLPDELSKVHLDCEASPEEATVCLGVRFTRLQYARLKSLRCQLPQRFGRSKWRPPKGMEGSVSEKAMQLGAMLCAGLEAAYLQGPRSATATLRWTRLLAAVEDCPRSVPATPAAHRALAQQFNLDEPFREAFLRIYNNSELLAAVDLDEQWRDRDDLEEWLQVEPEDLDREMQARQAEFDRFDQKRSASRHAETKDAAKSTPDELQAEIAKMGSKISGLLQGSSSLDGVERAQQTGATASTATDSGDSSSEGSDEQLDVLGMEDDFAEASEGEDDDEKDGEDVPEGRMEDYYSELDDQLENVLDGELAGQEAAAAKDSALPLSSRHVKVHASDPLELDLHAMEHVLASFCSEHQLEPGPASVLLGELGLAGKQAAALDSLD
mmetsp:Transcript_59127/g.138499  ORF Transcript_59127/g.138499 Transcript_59127/m.138499 type:complete len:641 (+) Transcript_59127:37-1959(+)